MLHSKNMIFTHKIYKVDHMEKVDDGECASCGIYVFFYICIFFVGSFLLSCYGYSLQDCMFEFSSALSTVGLSAGIMNYDAPSFVLWIGTIGMFIGRLEIYVVFMAAIQLSQDAIHTVKNMKRRKLSAIIGAWK